MEWFVEVVLFLDNRLKQWPSAPPLTSDDLRIDNSRVAHINPPPSTSPTLRENAFSSDLSVICELFLTALLILEDRHSLNSPPDPDDHPLVVSRIFLDILDSFVKSKDILIPETAQADYYQALAQFRPKFQVNTRDESRTISCQVLRPVLTRHVGDRVRAGLLILPEHSLFQQKDVENSKELTDVVKDALKRYSKEKVREEFDSFEGWKGLMRKIVANEETVCDISFVRTWIFRPTLTSLLSKHQHLMSLRPPSLPLPSAHRASSLSNHSLTSSESNDHPFQLRTEIAEMTTLESSIVNSDLHLGSSSSLTFSQTDTDTSSASLSLEAQPPPSLDTQSSSSPARSDTGWMISTLHNLISAPLLPSSILCSNSDATIFNVKTSFSHSLDLNETFNSSLFDEADEDTIVNALDRLSNVYSHHGNLSIIDDPPAFVDRLVGALGSSHARLRVHSLFVLMLIISQMGVEIVSELHRYNLRSAFRDGTKEEQTFFVYFLVHRFEHLSKTNTPSLTQEISDFDFAGFLTADLSKNDLFAFSILFVVRVWRTQADYPTTRHWAMDFLLRFEHNQNVLGRVCEHWKTPRDPSPDEQMLSYSFMNYAVLLSYFHRIAFPEEVTRFIENNQTHVEVTYPSLYLSHTSLNPKYRRNVFPIELLFERQARSDPFPLLRTNTEILAQDSTQFLHTPLFGLHSLLIRGFFSSLPEEERSHQQILFTVRAGDKNLQAETLVLYSLFPPPLFIRLFLTPFPAVKTQPAVPLKLFLVLPLLVASTAPFGDCLSLKWMFQRLTPLNSDDEREVTLIRDCREVVIALHWLNIPSHFDSPLLAHCSSLLASQPLSLRTSLDHQLSLLSLVTDPSKSSFQGLPSSNIFQMQLFVKTIREASLVLQLSTSDHLFTWPIVDFSLPMISRLMIPFPAAVSVLLEMFHRLVLTCSDEAKMKLVKHGLLDVVVVAVSQSSFLSDYESGIVVIGGLLDSIHRMSLQNWIVGMDFSSLLGSLTV
ncbi:hypothetical protein BLNAU_11628 [Blattamonas nauphoetae]|uniref:Uncharacterized protein n=1 Tax=Blattamonas nauphoetae TaxID=2049346 RepID=A0ABQ9XPS0_9EUKA|nr:hypothetical protein BLNAU_11628 [Blattamonas nauphoetae]